MKFNLSSYNFKEKLRKLLGMSKNHIVLIWSLLGFLLLLWSGYIFYFKIYIPSITELSAAIQLQTVQKGQIDRILNDLSRREKNKNEFNAKNIIDPFQSQP